jgi:uncharacterized repeat protein (TIGR03803 family)
MEEGMRKISPQCSRRLILVVLSLLSLSPYSRSQGTEFCPLTSFGTQPGNPAWPQEPGRITAVNGMLYTTSTQGGTHNQGTIYKISPVGELTVLWNFDGPTGAGPQGGLTDGGDGYLYGTTYGGGKFGVGTIFRIAYNGTRPEILYSFRNGYTLGYPPPPCSGYPCPGYTPKQRADISASYPISVPVVIGGTLWGVTTYTNNQNYGAIYSIPTTGGDLNFHVSCLFQPPYLKDKDMQQFVCDPTLTGASVLIAGKQSGTFYGTTLGGFGSVFEFSGGKVTVLHAFKNTDGNKPVDLMQASDGALYGTTVAGGPANWGVIYRLDPTGGFRVLYEFEASFPPAGTPGVPVWAGAPGAAPWGGLAEGRGNYLYGVARYGGHYGRGVIFRLGMADLAHPNYEVLHEFTMQDGRSPITTPLFVHYTNAKGEDITSGDMFGTTYEGGLNPTTKTVADSGVFYRLSVDQPDITGDSPLAPCPAQPGTSTAPCSFWDDPYVQVRAHVTVKQSVQSSDPLQPWRPDNSVKLNDAISIHMTCTDRPHIVQFISREKIINGQPYHGSVSSTAGNYLLTIDPANPCWNPDSIVKPNPYYDSGHQAHWSCSGLTIFDSPSFQKTASGEPSPIFVDNKNEIWRATARDYLICGGQVQKQVQWVVEQKFGGPRTYSSAIVQNVGAIPDSLLNLLTADGYSAPFAPKSTQIVQKCTQ